jgi:putative FmdB family regulatory protein
MPIYEYACKGCGQEFETLVRAASTPDCPSCHSSDLQKKLSVFSTAGTGAEAASFGACGTCGDPRGPGACSIN